MEGNRWDGEGMALLLFSRRWGQMEERPGDGNESEGILLCQRKGASEGEMEECRGGCSGLGEETGNEGCVRVGSRVKG